MAWYPEEATDSGRSGIRRKTFACPQGQIFLHAYRQLDCWDSNDLFLHKEEPASQRGQLVHSGSHSQHQHALGCLLCARREDRSGLLSFPCPFPSNSISSFHFIVLLFGEGGAAPAQDGCLMPGRAGGSEETSPRNYSQVVWRLNCPKPEIQWRRSFW